MSRIILLHFTKDPHLIRFFLDFQGEMEEIVVYLEQVPGLTQDIMRLVPDDTLLALRVSRHPLGDEIFRLAHKVLRNEVISLPLDLEG